MAGDKIRIYTKTGDGGETGLIGGKRVSKDSLRITAYGTVDELNALLGWVRAGFETGSKLKKQDAAAVTQFLVEIQNQLFSIGSALASVSPLGPDLESPITDEDIVRIERAIDRWEADLAPLRNFVLPGSGPCSAPFHLARTIARRAERNAVALSRQEAVSSLIVPYLNRLSDAFFVLSRWIALQAGEKEIIWKKESKK